MPVALKQSVNDNIMMPVVGPLESVLCVEEVAYKVLEAQFKDSPHLLAVIQRVITS